jgi:hypothetical protein
MVWQSRTTWQIRRAGRTAIAPVLKTGISQTSFVVSILISSFSKPFLSNC